jgi:hypothetical protein
MRQEHEKIYYDTTFEYKSTDKNEKKELRALSLDGKKAFSRRGVHKPGYEPFQLRSLDAGQVLRKRAEQ